MILPPSVNRASRTWYENPYLPARHPLAVDPAGSASFPHFDPEFPRFSVTCDWLVGLTLLLQPIYM
jgi:hypothetical protein